MKPGTFISGCKAQISFRDHRRVLKVNATASAMQSTLASIKATENFTPAEFAVEMIEGLQMVTFSNNAADRNE